MNKILLTGKVEDRKHEGIFKSDTRPGKLVELVGAVGGGEGSIQAHSSSTGFAAPLFAGPANLDPYGAAGPHAATLSQIEGTIFAGDEGVYYAAKPGDIVYAWLGAADTGGNGEGTVAAGDYVESDGTGALIDTNGGCTNPVAVAIEAANAPDSSTEVRAKFMVI